MSKVLTLTCPCDHPDPVPAYQYKKPPKGETRFDWKGQPYRRGYRRCQGCDHWSAEIHMDLTDFYRGGYVDGTYGDRMEENFKRILALPKSASDNAARVKRVLDFAKKRWKRGKVPELLDVGSGLAVFPFQIREAGWHVTALDPDARAAHHAKVNARVTAIHADVFHWKPKKFFDVITLNKVLEHVISPQALLARVKSWLHPNGFLYLEVPDVTAAKEGMGREEFFLEHLHVFSTKSLIKFASKSGYTTVHCKQIKEPSKKYTIVAFLN